MSVCGGFILLVEHNHRQDDCHEEGDNGEGHPSVGDPVLLLLPHPAVAGSIASAGAPTLTHLSGEAAHITPVSGSPRLCLEARH